MKQNGSKHKDIKDMFDNTILTMEHTRKEQGSRMAAHMNGFEG